MVKTALLTNFFSPQGARLCYTLFMQKANHNYTNFSLQKAKELRSDMTIFEQKLWFNLRAKRFMGLKFRRQAPIGNYIADFVCKEKNLIIELDGSEHLEERQTQHDEIRDKFLEEQGYKIIRVYNNEINNNIDNVLEEIRLNVL